MNNIEDKKNTQNEEPEPGAFNYFNIPIIYQNKKIKNILMDVKKIAPTNISVLIQGESGVGKDIFANLIYRTSHRLDKPFIVIDCGAIPEQLMESELFGYSKGAFTGANNDKEGFFEYASEGTIFLDEICNMNLNMQKKILRVIENKFVTPLGSTKAIKINTRIITAANINLLDAVQKGIFRHDLYQRISEFIINIPPLRERTDDIIPLANYFLDEFKTEIGKSGIHLSGKAKEMLLGYNWPGNIRELKNVIRRAAISAEKSILPENLVISARTIYKINDFNLNKGLMDYEIEIITETLKNCNHNLSLTAKILKISRSCLYSKILKLKININKNRL